MPSLRTNGTGSISNNTATTTSLSVPIGTGVLSGDIIILGGAWAVTATGSTFTTPTGFTPINTTTDSGASNLVSVKFFYKISDGTEHGTTVTLTHSTGQRCAAVSAAYQSTTGTWDGAFPTVTDDNGGAGATTQTSPTSPTPVFLSDMNILCIGAKQVTTSATAISFTQPSGYSMAIQVGGNSSAGVNAATAISHKSLNSTSPETSPQWSSNESVHWLSTEGLLEDSAGTAPLTLSAAATTSSKLNRQAGKPLAASVTTAATMDRGIAKTLSPAVTSAATVGRSTAKLIAANVTTAAQLGRQVAATLNTSATTTTSVNRSTAKKLSASVTSSTSLRARFVTNIIGMFTTKPTGSTTDAAQSPPFTINPGSDVE